MAEDTQAAAEPTKLQFHYIKGPTYREVPCHGAIGGVTPQGKISLAFYAERYPIPRIVQYDVHTSAPDATSVSLNEREATPSYIESRQGVIRHVEFCVYLDVETAQRLRDWLDRHISSSEASNQSGTSNQSETANKPQPQRNRQRKNRR